MISVSEATCELSQQQISNAKKHVESLLAKSELGFHQLTERKNLWDSARKRADEIKNDFDSLMIVGMGGSSLGTAALYEMLGSKRAGKRLEFFDNIDAKAFWNRLEGLEDLKRTHWVFISKSGSTVETLAMANCINIFLTKKGLRVTEKSTVVSELKKSLLTDWAESEGVSILEIPMDVGGRYSVLSPVGIFPAAFLGLDIDEIRVGANWSLQNKELVSILVARSLQSFDHEEWITLFWAYCDQLKNFGLWVQQLWSESLGKKTQLNGDPAPRVSTPMPCIGSRDQHSILQQVAEGEKDKFLFFIRVAESEEFGAVIEKDIFNSQLGIEGKSLGRLFAAQAQATVQSLNEIDLNSLTLSLGRLREQEVGALFMVFELVVGALGEALKIDAFNQPGVEAGKKLVKGLLQA